MRKRRWLPALVAWLVLAVVAWWWLSRSEGGPAAGLAAALSLATEPRVALLAMVVAFLLRPLFLLPVTVITAFCGWLLGPWLGLLVAAVGASVSALIPYLAARWARGRPSAEVVRELGLPELPARRGWRQSLSERPFEAVLLARVMMMPGDLVNVAAGVLRIPLHTFLLASLLGGGTGLAVGVWAGAALPRGEAFSFGSLQIDMRLVWLSLGMWLLTIGLSWWLRRRRPELHTARRKGKTS